MKKLLLIPVFLFAALLGQAQQKASKESIRTLLEMSGSARVGIQVMTNMIASYKESYPEVPQAFWDDFLKEARPETLVEMIIPVYEKHYTQEEVQGLIAFYQSPLGKKVITTMPLIAQESYTIGTEWGKKLAEQVGKKLQEGGYGEEQQ